MSEAPERHRLMVAEEPATDAVESGAMDSPTQLQGRPRRHGDGIADAEFMLHPRGGQQAPSGYRAVSIDAVLSALGFGRFQIRLLTLCGLVVAADAVEVMQLSFLQVLLKDEWDLSVGEEAALTSAVFGGQLIGAYCWGPFSDRYGRRVGYLCATTTVATFGLISAMAPSLSFLLVCRSIVGFGVAGGVVAYDLLAEFLPPERRGKVLLATNLFWSLGSIYVAGLAWVVVEPLGWRWMMVLCSFPLIAAVLGFCWLPESPRWLLVKGRADAAMDVVRKAAFANYVGLPSNIRLTMKHHGEVRMRDLFSRGLCIITVLLWLIWFSFGFTYYGLVLLTPRVFTASGDAKFDYGPLFLSCLAEVFGIAAAMSVVDKLGRRYTMCASYVVAGVALLPMTASWTGAGPILFAMLARASINAASCSTWLITPELYPTEIRATAHGFANAAARIAGFFTPYWADSEDRTAFQIATLYAAINVIAGVFSVVQRVETTGRTLDECDNDPVEIVELRRELEFGNITSGAGVVARSVPKEEPTPWSGKRARTTH